ncbi:MAG TPA: T9SS type A sorting domain-containing protein, partial [Phaeodactylibacter sp.]|nr:T9SS type A sorting domain-containing protein [Phaeodactylibacter sp.]
CEDCKTVQCFEIKEEENCDDCTEPLTISSTTEDICRRVWWEWDYLKYYEGYYYSSGLISIVPEGGCQDYSIAWDDGDVSGFERIISDPGTYCATIYDPCCNVEIHTCWTIDINYTWYGCNTVDAFIGINPEVNPDQILSLVSENWKAEIIVINEKLYLQNTFQNIDSVEYDLYHVLLDTKIGKIAMKEVLQKENLQVDNNEENSVLMKEHFNNPKVVETHDIKSRVFPNPFENNVVIEINSADNFPATIFVYDILGRKVLSKNVEVHEGKNNFKIEFNTNNRTSGLLTITIVRKEKIIDSFKVIKR